MRTPFPPSDDTTSLDPALTAQPTPVPLRVPDDYYETPRRESVESLLNCPVCDEYTMTAGYGCPDCGTSDSTTS